MKKILTSLTLILLLTSLYAAPVVNIAPYQGAFGVPLASQHYTYDIEKDNKPEWVSGSTIDKNKETYQNSQMIALLGGYDIPYVSDDDINQYSLVIEATCAGGFFFTSQSNPAFKRPFQILFLVKEVFVKKGGSKIPSADKLIIYKQFIGEGSNTTTRIIKNIDMSKLSEEEKKDISPTDTTGRIFCDVLLVLPFDDNGIDYYKDTVTWEKKTYPLIESNDYIAQVQFNVQLLKNETLVGEYSITVPFSGYYNKEEAIKGNSDSLLTNSISNMYVTPSSSAARIDIQSAITTGSPIHVGDINMWMGLTGYKKRKNAEGKIELYKTVNGVEVIYNPEKEGPKIFASAYRDPTIEGSSDGFALVHDSVKGNNILTDTNSVGFTVRFTDIENGTHKDFKGNTNYAYYKNNKEDEWIKPEIADVPNNPPGGSFDSNYFYFHYIGRIEVILDSKDNPIMFPGRYTGNIYIHLVTGE